MGLTTAFVGIDEAAFGDGSADTQPADAWLQRRLQYNVQDVLSGRSTLCHSPLISSANDFATVQGIRPYASSRDHTVWYGWLPISIDQRGVSLTLAYQSVTPGSATDAGDVTLVVDLGDGTTVETQLASTYASGVKTGHVTIPVTFRNPVRAPGLMRCIISVRSSTTASVGTTIGINSDGTSTDFFYLPQYHIRESNVPANAFWDPNSSGAAPDGDSLEAMRYVPGTAATLFQNSVSEQSIDLLYCELLNSGGSKAGVVGELPGTYAIQDPSSGTALMHQCFFLRAMGIQPIMGSSAVAYAASAIIDPRRFAPNQVYNSTEEMLQIDLIRRAYTAPRTVLVGPRGRKGSLDTVTGDVDVYAYFGYPTHWPFVMGDYDDTTTGQETEVINESLFLTTENPQLELTCIWLSVQHGAFWGFNSDPAPDTKVDDGRFDKPGFVDVGGPGSATWDLTISVDQIDDVIAGTADWAVDSTQYAGRVDTIHVPVWGANVLDVSGDVPPVLRGVDALEQNSKGVGDPPSFWFKEGSLFKEDVSAGLLYETVHRVDVAGMTPTETVRPVRLHVNADLDTFDDPVKIVGAPSVFLRLMLVGYMLIEIPQEP